MNYDLLVVGSGLSGAMAAYHHSKKGKRVLLLEKTNQIGGFCHTDKVDLGGEVIDMHSYGVHVFHTNRKDCWDFVNSITPFYPFSLNIKSTHKGKIYSLPFNMNTFYQLYGTSIPSEAEKAYRDNPEILIDTLVRGYTEKQWSMPLEEVSPGIIKRLPLRFTWDNNYFKDLYVGIPEGGYTEFIGGLLEGVDIRLGVDYNQTKEMWKEIPQIIYTGKVDELLGYKYGKLDYRCLRFEHEILQGENYQGCPVMNYADKEIPWTRIVEHKHFRPYLITEKTVITKEYPSWEGLEAYPIDNPRNQELYQKYLREVPEKITLLGRLAEYKYYDMNQIVEKFL